MRIAYDELRRTICRALINAGLSEERALACAKVHADSSCDGVASHGLNRVPRFVDYVQRGWIDITAEPEPVQALGAIEVYDGGRGIGVCNALFALNRAKELASEQGMALVALRNTTHWMRGGSYGWIAAEAGYAAICWTNTESVMPAWGARTSCIGNNPLVIAVPGGDQPLVLDMAMSQYSYGKLQSTRLQGEMLPYPGGFDESGQLTCDPAGIEQTRRLLPAGMWKGSGLAVMLDAMAALLSQGLCGAQIDEVGEGSCTGASQVFLLFDPRRLSSQAWVDELANTLRTHLTEAVPVDGSRPVSYPGQSTRERRCENREQGVPVDPGIWAEVCKLAASGAERP